VGVAAAAPDALLLGSNQLLGLPEFAELPPPGVPAVLAEHALHLCACSQTFVERTHTSDLTLQSFSIRKDIQKSP
jgi:hypothetical protein